MYLFKIENKFYLNINFCLIISKLLFINYHFEKSNKKDLNKINIQDTLHFSIDSKRNLLFIGKNDRSKKTNSDFILFFN